MCNFTEIKEFAKYLICKCGVVKHLSTGRLKSTYTDKFGYICIKFNDNKKTYHRFMHRLIAQTFIPNPNNLPQVNHKNGIKSDNRIENLEWCSLRENLKHAYKLGLADQKGEKNNHAKLTRAEILEITSSQETNNFLSKKYGVSKTQIYRIKNGYSWNK